MTLLLKETFRLVHLVLMMPRGLNAKIWTPIPVDGLCPDYDETTVRVYWYKLRLPEALGRWVYQWKKT